MAQAWTPKKRSSLIKRLRGWLFVVTEEREPLSSIVLYHSDEAGKVQGPPAFTWYQNSFTEAEVLATSVMDTSLEDANNIGGVVRYRLVGKFGGGAVEEGFEFVLFGAREDEADTDLTDGSPREKPTSTGFLSQVMRHMEVRDRTFMNTMQALVDKFGAENESLRRSIEAAENRRVKMIEVTEAALNQEADRRRADLDAEAKRRMMLEAVGTAKMLAPVIGNYFAGEKIFPEQDMTQEMLAQFFDTLPPENWRAMVSAAPAQHQMALNMLLKQHLDRKEKKQGTYQGDRPLEASPAAPQLGSDSNGQGKPS